MTLKEWKARLQPGVQVKQIRNGHEGECEHILTVKKVQTNGVKFEPRGYIDFPKRDEIVFTENGWQRLKVPGESQVLSEYVWV